MSSARLSSSFLNPARPSPTTLLSSLSRFSLTTPHLSPFSPSTTSRILSRPASHASQGRANGPAQGPGKRLGAKRGATELVVPGNIIFRQRGTLWHAGENTVLGRDHTISSLIKGYVRYYRDPERHPKRKYIGVVYGADEVLPRGRNMARVRRLGMEGQVMEPSVEEGAFKSSGREMQEGALEGELGFRGGEGREKQIGLRRGYQYRESNTEIGKLIEEAQARMEKFEPGNRWLAWRKRSARKAKAEGKRLLRRRKK